MPRITDGRLAWRWIAPAGLVLACSATPAAAACEARTVAREVGSAQEIGEFVRLSGMTLLSFVGYSGAGYEDEAAMLAQADQVLERHDPARTMVNIGATAQGIGAVYELARRRGYFTLGIVSSLARDAGTPLSPCVDAVFFVRDAAWGGRLPGLPMLSPTSAAMVANSQVVVGIGGGEIARDELLAARAAARSVTFIPANMNHRIARDKARVQGQPEPVDFRGAAHAAFAAAR
jgi:hypothetical protein